MESINSFLQGFEFIESDRLPIISLDKFGRFNVNMAARRLLGVKPYDTLVIGYNAKNEEIAVIPSKYANGLPGASFSKYAMDKRYYMSARALAKNYKLIGQHHLFVYDRGMSDGSAFIFRRSTGLDD